MQHSFPPAIARPMIFPTIVIQVVFSSMKTATAHFLPEVVLP